ncbi:hypothetical protein MKW98_016993 [Papaver atlanticum]|uniref:Fumarate lyase N-terminal domain-containing protein n=1 Tax=Papaver atlanticum TaxID=357466 RepID=A0AAD4TGZ5_9MAGN|nr:hypothetical protein MKW98_016993 [Papaver atlanticum]
MEVAGAAAVRVSVSSMQLSSFLNPRLSSKFGSSSSSCYLNTSNAPFISSTKSSFPHKAGSLSASINDNLKPVTAEMKRMKIEEDLSELDRLFVEKVSVFDQFMSNYGLLRSHVLVQIKWLIKLSQIPQVTVVPSFTEESLSIPEGIIDKFDSDFDYRYVTRYSRIRDNDAEAIASFLPSHANMSTRYSYHACTREDLIKLAYAFSLKETINKVMLPVMDDLIRALCKMAKDNADVPMLYRTDNEAAATTLGKEIAIFAARLSNERHRLSKVVILGDFTGSSGNHNANLVAYPEVDWQQVTKEFVVETLGLSFNHYMRVEPHDYMVDLVYATYASFGFFNQISEADEFKSLTTPHEVKHLDQITAFCGSRCLVFYGEMEQITKDGEFGWSSSTLSDYAEQQTATLSIKKMSEILMSHLLSYKVALLGIGKLQVNKTCLKKDLEDLWDMLLVPANTVMQRYGLDLWRYD